MNIPGPRVVFSYNYWSAGHERYNQTELLGAIIFIQEQASQNSSMDEKEAHEVICLAEKLWDIGGY